MKLSIMGDHNEVVKTYTADAYRLKWGVVTRVLSAVDTGAFRTGDSVEVFSTIMDFIGKNTDEVDELLFDIYPDLTVDELENAPVDEIVGTIIDVVKYGMSLIGRSFTNSKN